MRPVVALSWLQLREAVAALAQKLEVAAVVYDSVWGIPTGGAIIALLLAEQTGRRIVDEPRPGTLICDDICDSGETLGPFAGTYPTAVLHVRPRSRALPTVGLHETDAWVKYPYEKAEAPGQEVVTRMIELVGDDPRREGLRETPARVVRAWSELFAGYKAAPMLTTFDDGSYDEIVISRDITFCSVCEHHWLPFYGRAHVGYLPRGRIIGLSKLSRVVDKYARRLQVQERMTQQIAQELMEALDPAGVAVVVEGTHFCMLSRGVRQQESVMVTSTMLGRFRESAPTRAEFFALIKK